MFPCSGCGLCCQNIAGIKELQSHDRGDGICKYFDFETKGCSIYEQRPLICQVDGMYAQKYAKEYTQEEFYRLNANVCNALQEQYQYDTSYRVKIGE